MRQINIDEVACPECGTSGKDKDNLNACSQIEYTGRVDGKGWISCPGCGECIDFTEDGEIVDYEGPHIGAWASMLADQLESSA